MVDKPGIYFYDGDSYKELLEVFYLDVETFRHQLIVSGNQNAPYYDDKSWNFRDAGYKSMVGTGSFPVIERKKEVFELIFGEIVMFNPRR
jgi:hypothetical protein